MKKHKVLDEYYNLMLQFNNIVLSKLPLLSFAKGQKQYY